jgi:hypothetical protein
MHGQTSDDPVNRNGLTALGIAEHAVARHLLQLPMRRCLGFSTTRNA